jgi:hypothetical protein
LPSLLLLKAQERVQEWQEAGLKEVRQKAEENYKKQEMNWTKDFMLVLRI